MLRKVLGYSSEAGIDMVLTTPSQRSGERARKEARRKHLKTKQQSHPQTIGADRLSMLSVERLWLEDYEPTLETRSTRARPVDIQDASYGLEIQFTRFLERLGAQLNTYGLHRADLEELQQHREKKEFSRRLEEYRDSLLMLARLPEGWNGGGAQVISSISIAYAAGMLSYLEERYASNLDHYLEPVILTGLANGGIQMEWEVGSRLIELEIGPNELHKLLVFREGKLVLKETLGFDSLFSLTLEAIRAAQDQHLG